MSEGMDKPKLYSSLFMNLILSFHSAAMQQMGKLKNPLTDKVERNLEQAKMSIEMLDMIKAKTAKNLSEEEERFLNHLTSEVKLNYVEELNKDEAAPEKDEEVSEE
jgi:hypothetical protein